MSVCLGQDEPEDGKLTDYQLAVNAGAYRPITLASFLRWAHDKGAALIELQRLHPTWFDSRPRPAPKPAPPKPPAQGGREYLVDRPTMYIGWQGPLQFTIARHLAQLNVMLRLIDYTVDQEFVTSKYTGHRIRWATARRNDLLAFATETRAAKENQ